MVIQCNASNVHGYVLANGYINVFGKIIASSFLFFSRILSCENIIMSVSG